METLRLHAIAQCLDAIVLAHQTQRYFVAAIAHRAQRKVEDGYRVHEEFDSYDGTWQGYSVYNNDGIVAGPNYLALDETPLLGTIYALQCQKEAEQAISNLDLRLEEWRQVWQLIQPSPAVPTTPD